jgi:GH15 family glucan-1,4-alpha-glucosidase
MVAAPTLGLPESIGGTRNYDYRYAWIRDASLSAASLSSVGDGATAEHYLRWLSGLKSSTDSPLQVVYDVRGRTKIPQHRVRQAAGYRTSQPVRIGNHAYDQRQLGSLGFLVDCMASAREGGAAWRPEYSALLRRVVDYTCRSWSKADSGIWELEHHQQFVASKVMCWVVLDRAAAIAQRIGGFEATDVTRWRALATTIRDAIQSRGYGEGLGAFRQRYDHDTVDASALLVPLMGFLPPDDPRVLSTMDRIEETLGFEGFLYRFRPDETKGEVAEPLGQFEGAFLPCTFWLATARAMAGQIDRAEALLQRAENLTGDVGLFPEEVDPRSGQLLGNYPLLFSHVEHIRAIVALRRARSVAGVP